MQKLKKENFIFSCDFHKWADLLLNCLKFMPECYFNKFKIMKYFLGNILTDNNEYYSNETTTISFDSVSAIFQFHTCQIPISSLLEMSNVFLLIEY